MGQYFLNISTSFCEEAPCNSGIATTIGQSGKSCLNNTGPGGTRLAADGEKSPLSEKR